MATKTAKGFVCVHVIKHTIQGLFVERDNGQSQSNGRSGRQDICVKKSYFERKLVCVGIPDPLVRKHVPRSNS
jgi:hypothetical protein